MRSVFNSLNDVSKSTTECLVPWSISVRIGDVTVQPDIGQHEVPPRCGKPLCLKGTHRSGSFSSVGSRAPVLLKEKTDIFVSMREVR